MVLYELGGNFRQIYTDGRTLPAEYNLPAYLGYSVGRLKRDTFDDPKMSRDDDIFEMFPQNEKDCDRIAKK